MLTTSMQAIRSEVSMEGNFQMVQKYPELKVLPNDHPCVDKLRPVYIDRLDGRIKLWDWYTVKEPTEQSFDERNQEPYVTYSIPQEDGTSQMGSPSSTEEALPPVAEEIKMAQTGDSDITGQFGPEERFSGEDLYRMNVTEVRDLVEDLIPSGEISVLAGKGDTGKTTLYFQLCLSIVTRKGQFLDRNIHATHNSVLVIATEDSMNRIAGKIQKQLTGQDMEGTSLENLIVHVTGDDLLKRLEVELKNKKFDLVVLDALGDLLLEDINSQTEVRKFYSTLEKLIREFHITILLVHHLGKTQSKDKRTNVLGSTAIVDRARNVLMLEKDNKNGTRWITIIKSNNLSDDKKNKQNYLKFDPETLTYSAAVAEPKKEGIASPKETKKESKETKGKPGRKMDQQKLYEARRLRQEGKTEEEIGKILGKDKSTICRWFRKYPTYDLTKDYGDL